MDTPTREACVVAYRAALAQLADERRGDEDAETMCIPDCDGVRADCRCKGNVAEPGCEETL